jgi:beta-phosphoglucomutase
MKFKGCIFDLDGVIVDTAKYHFLAWKRLADRLNIPFTEKDNERLKGVSRMASLEIILELGKINPDPLVKTDYATLKNEWYVDYISRMQPEEILPGAVDLLTELRRAGIKIAIGSASRNTPMILERTGITDLFDAVADGNNVTRAKPDPEVFLVAADKLKLEPPDCIVFEDAIAGIEAAHRAGMKCIGIGSPELLSEADFIAGGLYDLTLKKLLELL